VITSRKNFTTNFISSNPLESSGPYTYHQIESSYISRPAHTVHLYAFVWISEKKTIIFLCIILCLEFVAQQSAFTARDALIQINLRL